MEKAGLERWLIAEERAASAEDPNPVPSTRVRQLTTAWNSGSRGSDASGPP